MSGSLDEHKKKNTQYKTYCHIYFWEKLLLLRQMLGVEKKRGKIQNNHFVDRRRGKLLMNKHTARICAGTVIPYLPWTGFLVRNAMSVLALCANALACASCTIDSTSLVTFCIRTFDGVSAGMEGIESRMWHQQTRNENIKKEKLSLQIFIE